MFKKALVALALFLLPVTGAFAQTNSNSAIGFYLSQGSTYAGYTCPSTQISPCFVPYGSAVPISGTITPSGTQDVNITKVGGNSVTTTVPVSGTVTTIPTYPTPTSSSALAANVVVCGAACKLSSFNVSADSTLSGAAWWVMIYNATTAPVDGAVTPLKCYAIPSGATSFSGGFSNPITFSTGVTIGVSTTGCFTKTASTHAFISGDSQ